MRSPRDFADAMNRLTPEQIARVMENLPTDALEWAVQFEALSQPPMVRCTICQGDGWLAYPTWADAEKKLIRIRKVRCPNGCPLADPNEPGVLPDYPQHEGGGTAA